MSAARVPAGLPATKALDVWAGLGRLLGFATRRDRFRLPVWIVAVVGMELLLVHSLISLYPDAASRAGAATTLDNAGSTALIGPVYHAQDYHWGVMTGHQTLILVSVAVALMSILIVVRHTRAEEETGRAELVRAAQVGRHTTLATGVLMSLAANLVLAVALAGSLTGVDARAIDAQGAMVFAAAVAVVGLVFTGVAAVIAQLAGTARATATLAALVLGASFLVRGAGDVADSGLSWLSPLAWSQHTYPWEVDRWWPLAIGIAAAAVLLALAAWLSTQRDVGAALWAGRNGRTSASRALSRPVGLAARLSRSTALGWALALFVFGLLYGPVLQDADTFLTDMPVLGDFLPGTAAAGGVRLFASIVVALAALIAAVPATQVVTRLCTDELAGRTAMLLANSASRLRWFGATVFVALATAALVLAAFGLGFGLTAAAAVDDVGLLRDIVWAPLGYLPAVAVVIGVAAVLTGWLPRLVGLVWLVVAHAVIVLYFAGLLDWPSWATWPSAFHHVAARPAVNGDTTELLWLSGAALVLILVGAVGYRRRAIH